MLPLLLMQLPGEPGLICKITAVLFAHGLSILRNDKFLEPEGNVFFTCTKGPGAFDTGALRMAKALPAAASIHLSDNYPQDVVLLVTKKHHCLRSYLR